MFYARVFLQMYTLYYTYSVQLSCCTQMYFQLNVQYIDLTPLQDSAAKLSHLQGATVHEDTPSVLYNLSAVNCEYMYRGADKSLARPGRKQATATKL